MLWRGREGSGNVEDRRGIGGGGIAVGGGLIGVIVLLFNLFTGGDIDPSQLPIGGGQSRQMSAEEKAAQDELAQFSSVVLRDAEVIWNRILPEQAGVQYQEPRLVLFTDAVQSACGNASSAVGPFYCPGDSKLYIDLSFFNELEQRFGAAGDFAMAYVIAHEVGHHVQNLLGTSAKVQRMRQQLSQGEYNKYSVMLELQADYYAGVWAHYVQGKGYLESGDVEEALRAANAIGDDQLQKQAQGHVVPESFTHGTSAQRMYWFKKGLQTGDLRQGDTFNDPSLN
ncbi:neutral zinc metallopeptidase [Flavisolibacter sp. BT320]|nr:neutral zinc metallopeptidase [Flavisolibacter longurius]